MPITKEDLEVLHESMEKLETALYEIDNIIRDADESLYERWKAYGKHVTNEFIIGGPSLPEVIEQLENDVVDEEEQEFCDELAKEC
jgi:hypothetical protein